MNYQYFGLFLDEPTRNKLMQVIIGNPIICNLVFQRGSTIYLDHCTLLHKINMKKRWLMTYNIV